MQVSACDEPGRLIILLDRAPRRQRRRAPLDRARVDADALEPGGIERNAGVARAVMAGGGLGGGKGGGGRAGVVHDCRHIASGATKHTPRARDEAAQS